MGFGRKSKITLITALFVISFFSQLVLAATISDNFDDNSFDALILDISNTTGTICEGCISGTITPGFWITVEDDRLIIPLGITTLDIRLCDFWMIALVIIAIIISLCYYKKRKKEKLTKRTVCILIALWILVAIGGLLADVCYVKILISVVILLNLVVFYIYKKNALPQI